jgi:hypothetical protein
VGSRCFETVSQPEDFLFESAVTHRKDSIWKNKRW